MASAGYWYPESSRSTSVVAALRMRTFLSPVATITRAPSGVIRAASIHLSNGPYMRWRVPVSASHRIAVLSWEPERIERPSALKTTECTMPV